MCERVIRPADHGSLQAPAVSQVKPAPTPPKAVPAMKRPGPPPDKALDYQLGEKPKSCRAGRAAAPPRQTVALHPLVHCLHQAMPSLSTPSRPPFHEAVAAMGFTPPADCTIGQTKRRGPEGPRLFHSQRTNAYHFDARACAGLPPWESRRAWPCSGRPRSE